MADLWATVVLYDVFSVTDMTQILTFYQIDLGKTSRADARWPKVLEPKVMSTKLKSSDVYYLAPSQVTSIPRLHGRRVLTTHHRSHHRFGK